MFKKHRKALYKQVEVNKGRIVGISDADLNDLEKEELLAMSYAGRESFMQFPIPPHVPYNMRTTVIPPQCLRGHRRAPGESYVDIVRKVEPVAYWFSHTPEQRQENCDLMKMYMMWPVFMHASNNTTTYLRTKDPMSHEMTNKELTFIDLLEDLAELFKKVAERRSLVECSFKIGWKMEKAKYKQKICYIGDAMLWIEAAGDDDLYKTLQLQDSIRAQVLQTFFTDYAFFFIKMAEEHRILSEEVKMQKCQVCEQEYELHKAIGKQEFANENFIKAENAYTNAIYFSPENHILFSNRALCYIRLQKYRKALMDGKKAIILKNTWPKGHYRFCEALFSLGEMELAIAANEKAQKLCKNSAEGIRDLVQQHSKFETLMKEAAAVAEANAKKTKKKSTNDKSASQDDSPLENRGNQSTPVEETLQKETSNATNVGSEDGSESTSVPQQKKGKSKGKSCESSEKIKSTGTKNDSKEAQRILSPTYAQMDVASVTNMVSSLVREAYDALSDKRCHNAEGIFSRVLEILSQYDVQSLRLTKMDHVVLLYGHANALLGIRKSMELERAENRFKEIIHHHSKERFNCLAFFGIGNVYLKQNRFSDALVQYVKSKTMLTHKMVPGVLTWPTTSIVLEETRPENLEVLLNNCIEECKFPPKPDAMCRFQNCLSLPKIQIYFTDPDFKGFIRMVCCQCCIVEYHVCCWKKLKTTLHSDKHDKDFLRFSCLTPDCRGVISHIVIYDSTGEVKCEFEDKMLRKKEPHKPAVKNKGTSIKKQKVKHENKSERKKTIEEEPVDQQHSRIKVKRQEKVLPDPVVINGYHIPRDPLLLQVMQKQHLIIKGCPMSFPGFWESITAWRVISIQELNEFEKNISPPSQSDSKMKNLLNHLYKQNDRIKTRVLLYLLKVNNEHISSDLHKWIIMVDEKGLHAAEEFRNHNGEHLRSIKAQDVINLWNKSYGNIINHEIEDTHSNSLYDTLSSMNSNDFRCFLWFLEGNRDVESVASLGKELDKYFQEMDVPCDKVPAYSLEDLSNKGLKVKPKHRKKKQNQPKPIYKLSGAVSTRSQEDDIFTEENTLSLLDPYEPFTVPEFLRRDIDEFQNIYDPDMFENRYLMMVDDSMDPVRETLYEYFAQILEEHGPLSLDDEILVGEYKNFPEETQRMVEVSGGLKDFLLESYWFAMEGDLVALTGYDIPSLEESGERPQLNPTAREFRPSSYRLDISDNIDLYSDLDQRQPKPLNPSTADTRQPLSLYSGLNLSYTEKSNICDNLDQQNLYTIDNPNSDTDQEFGDDTDEASIISSNDSGPSSEDQNITRSENEPSSQENPPAGQLASNKTLNCENEPRTKRTAIVSVQVNTEMSHCAVNTDAFKPFESRQGDILQMEKEQVALKDQLKEATEKYASLKSRFQEEIASLEGQIKDTVEKNKITKKELTWLQQEYENESKKWHQEKKENQEKIKALKNNIKSTIDASDSCSRSIEEKKKQYENYIKDFAKIHYSKFDKEKAALEENIKKCEEQWEETKQRSIAAEVIVFENRKQCELLKMRIRAATIDRNIKMFNPVVLSNPAAPIAPQLREMKLAQLKLNKEMEILQVQFDEKINSVKRGLKLNNIPETPVVRVQSPLSPSELPLQPPPGLTRAPSSAIPANTAKSVEKETVASKKGQAKEAKKPPASNAKRKNPILVPLSTQRPTSLEGAAHSHPDPALASSAKPTLFDKIILELHDIFPDYKSAELTNFIKDFRSRNNGTLSGLTHEDIISRVTEHILDYQSKNMSAAAAIFKAGPAMPQPVSPQPKQPWKVVNTGAKNKWQKPNDLESCNEDPCIICHDELKQFPMHRLDCGHCFHKECIRTWLNTQSTCPTCREHALLPDDFPALPLPPSGRMRTV